MAACGVPGAVGAGNTSEIGEGELKKVEGAQVILGRDAGGIYAMTSLCTHQSCDLTEEGGTFTEDFSEIECGLPCGHGSRFTRDGNIAAGPASSPLRHWRVTVGGDGAISVEIGTEVAQDERAAVPELVTG